MLTRTIAANPVLTQEPGTSLFKSGQFSDFTPQNYDLNTGVRWNMTELMGPHVLIPLTTIQSTANGSTDNSSIGYDPFTMSSVTHALPTPAFNPYAEDHTSLAPGTGPFYANQNAYSTPLQPVIPPNTVMLPIG